MTYLKTGEHAQIKGADPEAVLHLPENDVGDPRTPRHARPTDPSAVIEAGNPSPLAERRQDGDAE